MNLRVKRLSLFLTSAVVLAALPAAAGTVRGVVRNGTTNAFAPNTPVTLIQLQGGMQPIANTKTDSQGDYSFTNAAIGKQPMLVRASYRGVDYLQPIPPGQNNLTINIKVYNPTADSSAFEVLHQIVALEPQAGSLMVGVEFDIENQTKPPKSFFRPGGSFEFYLPHGAELAQAEAWGPAGMPVVQATIPKGKDRYAVSFPFKPGQNGVRFSYKMNYPGNQATLQLRSPYPIETAMLLAPPAMQISGNGFTRSGTEHGWAVYTRQGVRADRAVLLSVSGTGPIPAATGSGNSGQGQGQGQASAAGVTPVAQALPPRLDSVRWIVIGGFVAMFLLGAFFLWWKSRNPAAVAVAGEAPAREAPEARSHGAQGKDRVLRQSVEEIKETLFRLELRRQAGTLSEEDYLAQRQRMEKALRKLVKS